MTQTLPRPEQPVATNGHLATPRRGPHRPPRRVLVPVGLVVVVAAAAAFLLRPAASEGSLTASGTVEVDEVILAAQAPGQISELLVDEGGRVVEGQVVGRITDPVLDVQLKQTTVDPAQQQLIQAQVSRLELRAPLSGVVQKRLVHKGEVVAAGTPILTVADPTDLKLTLYVLEAEMGRVFVGQTVGVHADAFPDRTFAGRVQTLATRAEFTPRNVQTQKDRQNLVFAVTVRVPNPDGALKAGLPVDATFNP
ncbi:MAG TPA: HlyD family efflux transporter periplasmic adaptor subunit [Chloroflexota bacterium]|nr:HlyD family efflux transporter periplasmic adaptor subunit [Chloroflexota bacterium]